jgi:transcriptional regulator with XRE-family HTH domain
MLATIFLVDNLTNWIEQNQRARGWTQAELARRAGISQGAISRVLSGSRGPGVEFCKSIAKAFSVPDRDVLQIAGLMTDDPEPAPGQGEMAYIYASLPPDRQEQLREYARFLLEQDAKKTAPKPARSAT